MPTNLFGLKAIDWVHHYQLRHGKTFATDLGDAWNIRLDAAAELLDRIARNHDRAIVLTGDIHYAGAMEFSYRDRANNSTKIIQFTASPCKNQEVLTKLLQSKLKAWLLPELRRTCVGKFTPPLMQWQSFLSPFRHRDFQPDWWGKLRLVRFKSIKSAKKTATSDNILVRSAQIIRRYFYRGGEVIGFNNVAIVSWQQDERAIVAIQDVYWIAVNQSGTSASITEIPLSIARYQVAMDLVNRKCK